MTQIWNLTKSDFIKGAVITVISAVITTFIQMIENGFSIDIKQILSVALIAFLSYIVKQLGTDENGKFAGRI